MSRLEEELKNSLRRKEPPPHFAERLLMRLHGSQTPNVSGWQMLFALLQPPKIRWVAVSIITCLVVWFGVAQYLTHQQIKAEGEMARAQVLLALHIASAKLNLVQKVVQEKSNHELLSEPRGSH